MDKSDFFSWPLAINTLGMIIFVSVCVSNFWGPFEIVRNTPYAVTFRLNQFKQLFLYLIKITVSKINSDFLLYFAFHYCFL